MREILGCDGTLGAAREGTSAVGMATPVQLKMYLVEWSESAYYSSFVSLLSCPACEGSTAYLREVTPRRRQVCIVSLSQPSDPFFLLMLKPKG